MRASIVLMILLAVSSIVFGQQTLQEKTEFRSLSERILQARQAGFHNWGFRVGNFGLILYQVVDGNPFPGGEFPRGTDNFLIYGAGFEVGVLKNPAASSSALRYTVSQPNPGINWLPGPLLNAGVPFDSLDADHWGATDNVVYVIDTSRAGDDWVNWPWQDGAPLDSLGQPQLLSQQDTWAVYNDIDTLAGWCAQQDSNCIEPAPIANCYGCTPTDSPIRGIGIETRQSTYVFAPAPNVIFLRWRFLNRTNVVYDSSYVSFHIDPDIVNAIRDQMGTDTTRKMILAYVDTDENTVTGQQYAAGAKLLYFSGMPFMTSANWQTATYLDGSEFTTPGWRPFDVADTSIYYEMKGLDWDGTQRLASEGFVETDGSHFVFPGDPVTGQGLISDNPMMWPDGADVKCRISVGPFQLQPAVEYDFIVAVIGGESPDRLGAIDSLRNTADQLQNLFDNQIGHILGVSSTFSGPVVEFYADRLAGVPPYSVKFYDWSLTNSDDPTTLWRWDFDNDGTIDYQTNNPENPVWTYADPGVYSVKLVVTDAAGSDSLVKDSLITVYGAIATPFSDQFDSSPEPNPETWINTTTQVSDKSSNPPSPPYALALDSNPDGPEMITSYPFDLSGSGESTADTLLAIRYWYEGKGNGNAPEPDDSLIVEFRNNVGEWVKAKEYPGQSMSSFQPDSVFLDSVDAGPGATFYHDTFQFRFRGTSTPSSTAPHKDVWFVDDIYFGEIVVVDIEPDEAHGIPRKFKLHQNHPNPFNPSTTIKYDLPKESKVTITIFNVLGQEVRTLVDEPQAAGFRSVVWNGKNDAGNPVASGVYVYRIEAGGFVQTKKMMLLR